MNLVQYCILSTVQRQGFEDTDRHIFQLPEIFEGISFQLAQLYLAYVYFPLDPAAYCLERKLVRMLENEYIDDDYDQSISVCHVFEIDQSVVDAAVTLSSAIGGIDYYLEDAVSGILKQVIYLKDWLNQTARTLEISNKNLEDVLNVFLKAANSVDNPSDEDEDLISRISSDLEILSNKKN